MGDIDFALIAEVLGGGMLLIYALFQVASKIFSNIGVFKKWREKKEQTQNEMLKTKYQQLTDEFVGKFVPPIVEEIKNIDKEQNRKLDLLINSSNDILRREITHIYYKYRPYKKILQYDKEVVTKFYKDYHAQGGNTFIDDIWEEMKHWEVVKEKEDLQ